MELYCFVGKYIEVELYRKRYNTKDHIKTFSGRLTDIGANTICLEREGRPYWVPKPNMYKDKIKEVK